MLAAAALSVVQAGCLGDPTRRVAAPAPAGAVECASRALAELGYAPDGGVVDRIFVHLQRPPGALEAELVMVEEGGGELRLFVSTRNHRNRMGPPTEQSVRDAQSVVSRCAGDASDARAGAAPDRRNGRTSTG